MVEKSCAMRPTTFALLKFVALSIRSWCTYVILLIVSFGMTRGIPMEFLRFQSLEILCPEPWVMGTCGKGVGI